MMAVMTADRFVMKHAPQVLDNPVSAMELDVL
jgi:hypothetical protein